MAARVIGGHVSASGGIGKAPGRAAEQGFGAFQIHPTAPQSWSSPKTTAEEAAGFRAATADVPTFFHNIYLGNFASPDERIWHGSIRSTADYLGLAAGTGSVGVVAHVGSHKGLGIEAVIDRVAEGLGRALSDAPADAKFLIENTAGGGGTLGRDLDELELMFTRLAALHPNVGVCLDTCHAFAAGIPIHEEAGCDAFLRGFDARIGIGNLACFHLNDSKTPFGSFKDRHENIGRGEIGDGLRWVLRHPLTKGIPFVMEVPGDADEGPDAANRERAEGLSGS